VIRDGSIYLRYVSIPLAAREVEVRQDFGRRRERVILGIETANQVEITNGLKDGDYDITVVGNTAGRFAALKSGAASPNS